MVLVCGAKVLEKKKSPQRITRIIWANSVGISLKKTAKVSQRTRPAHFAGEVIM